MMKALPITRKQLMETYRYIICVGYCDLYNTLSMTDKMFYNSGKYGWNYSVYEVTRDTCICTGYRPIGNIKSDYNYNAQCEYIAKQIITANNLNNSQKEANLKTLLQTYAKTTIYKNQA